MPNPDIDIDAIAEDVEDSFSLDFRDPYEYPYGDPERQTESQRILWSYLEDHNIWRQALIGAKGAGKTYYGATFAFYFGQKYPGAEGAVVGNTDRQAKDAAGGPFLEVCKALGYNAEYFGSKKIRGQEESKFYIVDLDGQGYQEGKTFKLFVRSMESVGAMEGSQYDFMWVEEIQQAQKENFVTAVSRNRGTHIADEDTKNPLFVAGMTGGPEHWMYDKLEIDNGFYPHGSSEQSNHSETFDPEKHEAILREPVLTENKRNVGQATIDDYYNNFSKSKAERLIHAQRVSHNSNRALYEYKGNLHRKGRMSRLLCYYDPYDDLILSLDFNVSPMCVTLWQRRDWNQKWSQQNVQIVWNGNEVQEVLVHTGEDKAERYDSLPEYAAPNQKVLAQVDEFEVWPDDEMGGGTRGAMSHVVREYADRHNATLEVIGDAQGNSKTAAATVTNWDIVRSYASKFSDPLVMPGLITNRTGSGLEGEVKYSNPPVEDTLTHTNQLLQNAEGHSRLCFLPESQYESGGAAASVAAVEKKGNGKIDDKRDRSDDRAKPRTHFFDTVRYLGWYFNEEVDHGQDNLDELIDEMKADRRDAGTERMPEGMDPDRYTGFPDEDGGDEWLGFGGGSSGGVF